MKTTACFDCCDISLQLSLFSSSSTSPQRSTQVSTIPAPNESRTDAATRRINKWIQLAEWLEGREEISIPQVKTCPEGRGSHIASVIAAFAVAIILVFSLVGANVGVRGGSEGVFLVTRLVDGRQPDIILIRRREDYKKKERERRRSGGPGALCVSAHWRGDKSNDCQKALV